MVKTIRIDAGSVKFLVDVPAGLIASLEKEGEKVINVNPWDDLGSSLVKALRKTIPPEKRPPTSAQASYCESIAETLNVTMPASCMTNQDACSEFIERYSHDFDLFRSIEKKIYHLLKPELSIARKVNKGLEACNLMWDYELDENEEVIPKRIMSDEAVLDHFGVKRMATIQGYIDCFNEHSAKAWSGEDTGMKVCIDALAHCGDRPLSSYIAFYIVEAFVDEPTYVDVIRMFHGNADFESLIYSDRVYQHHMDKLFSLENMFQDADKE